MSAIQESSATARSLSLPDAWRVEVFRKPGVDDPDGAHLLDAARELGVTGLTGARAGRGTLLPPKLSEEAVQAIVRELLADPVLDDVRLTAPQSAPQADTCKHRVLIAMLVRGRKRSIIGRVLLEHAPPQKKICSSRELMDGSIRARNNSGVAVCLDNRSDDS